MKKAVIVGVESQEGYYLSELLAGKGYDVIALFEYTKMITDYIVYNDNVKYVNLQSYEIEEIIKDIDPDEIYNLYFEQANITRRILQCINIYELKSKYYQSTPSGDFESALQSDDNEESIVTSKDCLYSYLQVKKYREHYNIFACNGIISNNESIKNNRKYSANIMAEDIVMISLGLKNDMKVINLDELRDWGDTLDFVNAIYLMMHKSVASDYILSSDNFHTVREFIEKGFAEVGIDIYWKYEGVNEVGINKYNDKVIVRIDKTYDYIKHNNHASFNSSKATKMLDWNKKVSFDLLIKKFIDEYKNKYSMFLLKRRLV